MSENGLEITVAEGQFASLKLPALINFYNFTGIPKFDDSNEKQKLLEDTKNWNKKEKIEGYIKFARISAFIALVIVGLILYFKFHIALFIIFTILLFSGFILLIIKTSPIIKKYRNNAPEKQPLTEDQEYQNYLEGVFRNIHTKYLNGFRAFEFDNWGFLFYSKLGCTCIDLKSGEMVLYSKENIKDVLLEHVHLGTTTTGSAYTSGGMDRGIIFDFHYTQYSDTSVDTDSIQHYEWRLDILTDFLEFPKLSFRFADNSKGEDEAKIIYGILKP
ncbi:hypothetical protein R84B8_00930 [Treponema sp. R8-4-B8]